MSEVIGFGMVLLLAILAVVAAVLVQERLLPPGAPWRWAVMAPATILIAAVIGIVPPAIFALPPHFALVSLGVTLGTAVLLITRSMLRGYADVKVNGRGPRVDEGPSRTQLVVAIIVTWIWAGFGLVLVFMAAGHGWLWLVWFAAGAVTLIVLIRGRPS